MIHKTILTSLLVLILFSREIFSQVIGKCIDEEGKKIPFINVAVKMTNIGTVTDENGIFHLNGNLYNDIDSIIFSHIGYKTLTICSNRKDTILVVMHPSEHKLKEVTVKPIDESKLKKVVLGTKAPSGHIVMDFISESLGTEMGKRIGVKKGRKYYIEKIMFHISEIDYRSVKFRFNFYSFSNENKIETVRANYTDIIKEITNTGYHEVDISQEGITFSEDFLVSIEWIDFVDLSVEKLKALYDDPEKKGKRSLLFNCDVFCGPDYVRFNTQQNWRARKITYNSGLGIHLLTKYSNE